MNLKIKLCIFLIFAGGFSPYFAIAAGEDEIEIRSVLDIEGIQDFIDPDDYKDYMNDLMLNDVKDAVQAACRTNKEPLFCAAWSRFITARIHYYAVVASLGHLRNHLKGHLEIKKRESENLRFLYIKNSCAQEEIASYMKPACEALNEYAGVLKEIEVIKSPLEKAKAELEQLESQLDEQEDKLETLESQLDKEDDKLPQLQSQLEEEWGGLFAVSSDKEKNLMKQIESIEGTIAGMEIEIKKTEH